MTTYSKQSGEKVKKVMDEFKHGKLKSGASGDAVTNRKQAIAIGLSEARAEGDKVPSKKSDATRKDPLAKKVTTAKKSTGERTARA